MARKSAAEIRQMLRPHFPGVQAKALAEVFEALYGDLTADETSITNLNTWASTLATKLNADAGVTDTNYDTTPQS